MTNKENSVLIQSRAGDHHRTNRMFRRRIYAQGFTLLAMVAGSVYWEKDRSKRKEYDELLVEKKRTEKRDAWIRELEIRDAEDTERQMLRDRLAKGRAAEEKGLREKQAEALEKKIREDTTPYVRSVLEPTEEKRSSILDACMDLWRTR